MKLSELIDTLTGANKVVTSQPVRRGPVLGQPKDHIHAAEARRHWDGSISVTDTAGKRHELPAGGVKSIGPSVRTTDEVL